MAPGPSLPEWIEVVQHDAPSDDPLDLLATAAGTAADLDKTKDELLGYFVDRCRGAGRSWSEISGALGVTKQAAHRRFSMSMANPAVGRFTGRARTALESAPEVARSLNHNYVGTEHILLAILDDPESLASHVLVELGVTRKGVETAALVVAPRGETPPEGVIPLTPRAVTAVSGAVTAALELGHNYVGTEHLLLSAMRDPDALAARILAADEIHPADVRMNVVKRLNQMVAKRK